MSMLATLLRQVFVRTAPASAGNAIDARTALADAAEGLRSGHGDRALALCLEVLEHEPGNARALQMIATIRAQRGEFGAAKEILNQALVLDPGCADAWSDLGNVHRLANAVDDALACYAQALEIDPAHVVAALGRARLLAETGREREAIERLQARIGPDYEPLLLRELVRLLCRNNRFDEAASLCGQAIARNADNAEAHAAYGYLALVTQQDAVLALDHFDRAAPALPADADLSSNRGIALQQLGRLDEAVACYDAAIAIDPSHRAGRIHRSLALLVAGDYARGWQEYEYRRLADDWAAPPMGVPEWQGEDLQGKSIYVYAEQGIGDEILFASCVPDLLRRAARVSVECDPRLMPIFSRSFPAVAVYSRAQRLSAAQSPTAVGADCMIPMGSLPRYLRPHAASFATRDGYLCADDELALTMRARLSALPPGLRIGISWRGGTVQTGAANRSMRLEDLLPVLKIPHVSWVNMQYGDASAEIAALRDQHGIFVHQLPGVQEDYERTAALVCALDLVISVQTAIVNLCGALGRPVWVAVPLSPHWRYGLSSESTPWYASVRVMRQAARGDWSSVIAAMERQLQRLARESA